MPAPSFLYEEIYSEMMSLVRYYKLCLGLPLGLPAVAMILSAIVNKLAGPLSSTSMMSQFVGLLMMSVVVGGIPYLLTITALLSYGWNRDAFWYRNISFVLPLIYAVVLTASSALLFRDGTNWMITAFGVGKLGLLLGYAYVLLCHLGVFCLRRLGVITQA